jgi:DNA-binding NtrC family response regulator
MTDGATTILLVEDEILLCWILEEMLDESGYDVTLATTGADGLAAIEAPRHFDLLITNIRLKDGPDGWSLAQRARELDPQIGVLFVSGDSAHEHADKGVPGSKMLSKPFEARDIETAIAGLLENPLRESRPG